MHSSEQAVDNRAPDGIPPDLYKAYCQILRKCDIFSQFDDERLSALLQFCSVERYKTDTYIFTHEDIADAMYIIIEGHVAIERIRNGAHEHIAQFSSNEFFGQNGLFLDRLQGVSAITLSAVQLIRVPRTGTTIESLIADNPELSLVFLNGLISHITRSIRNMDGLIRENSQWIQELRDQVMIDRLMGIHTLVSFHEQYQKQISTSKTASLFMLKPTNFKSINDMFGHSVGDALLHYMGTKINQHIAHYGQAFRYKGNEVALLFLADNVNNAHTIVQAIIDDLSNSDLSPLGATKQKRLKLQYIAAHYPREHKDVVHFLEEAHLRLMGVFKREN